MLFSGLIVLLSKLFYSIGGKSFLFPGKVIEIFSTGFILLAFPTGDDYYSLPNGSEIVLNLLFYTLMLFLLFKGVTLALNSPLKPSNTF